jgi:hypothetical protein
VAYTGWAITEKSKNELLARLPPRYPDVICHHITLTFGSNGPVPQQAKVEVIGISDNGTNVEALVVKVDGETKNWSNDSVFHVTYSIDRSTGAKPVHSNDVIKNFGIVLLDDPFFINVTPRIFDFK